jgi:hypothetical protein
LLQFAPTRGRIEYPSVLLLKKKKKIIFSPTAIIFHMKFLKYFPNQPIHTHFERNLLRARDEIYANIEILIAHHLHKSQSTLIVRRKEVNNFAPNDFADKNFD